MQISRIAIIVTALLLWSLPASAEEAKSGCTLTLVAYNQVDRPVAGAAIPKDADQELTVKQAEFDRFVHEKVKQFNKNLQFSRERMQFTKLDDGSFLARYHQIDENSLDSAIRRSQSKSSPFVGVLSYQEKVYENHGKSPEDCRNGEFSLVQITPNRHIFCYTKGAWR